MVAVKWFIVAMEHTHIWRQVAFFLLGRNTSSCFGWGISSGPIFLIFLIFLLVFNRTLLLSFLQLGLTRGSFRINEPSWTAVSYLTISPVGSSRWRLANWPAALSSAIVTKMLEIKPGPQNSFLNEITCLKDETMYQS